MLVQAAEAVERGAETTSDTDTEDRLTQLTSRLRSQANRDATPALGTLDRVLTKLREIEDETSDPTVTESLEEAQEQILSFLATLDDRGMKQHRD